MTVFLKVAPLHPLTARLDYAGYETVEAPNGVASYLLRGTVTDPSSAARIGLQGTARISGDWSLLGYLIFRRPLATLRARVWILICKQPRRSRLRAGQLLRSPRQLPPRATS
ncbi:hypothetical protein [Enterobacter kobei]|uniref:hypothetical protein n=1 Tax=Enterobacter kobei TaxID=208224 RepID=UPI00388E90D3